MNLFDRYVLKNILVASIFVALTLSIVILLTQSLRFLELVIESGASSSSFWVLTILALPRFFEIIVPLALMVATIFTYNRMTMDSELVVARAAGFPPMRLARPAIILAALTSIFLWSMTLWVAPKALSSMNVMRQEIKAQFSNILFREGVFNQVGKGLTVYIRERTNDGEMLGLMIYDNRNKTKGASPSMIVAKRGTITAEGNGHQVLVFDGSRQEYDKEKNIMRRLNFSRYTIDLPDSGPVRQRWQEPDERTIFELLRPDMENAQDVHSLKDFKLEIHRRFIAPLLAPVYTVIVCLFLLLGPVDRRGQGKRIALSVLSVVFLQGLFLTSFNMAHNHVFGLIFMYSIVIFPLTASIFLLSTVGENFRRHLMYRKKEVPPQHG